MFSTSAFSIFYKMGSPVSFSSGPQSSFVSYRMLSILMQYHGEKHILKGDDSSIFSLIAQLVT